MRLFIELIKGVLIFLTSVVIMIWLDLNILWKPPIFTFLGYAGLAIINFLFLQVSVFLFKAFVFLKLAKWVYEYIKN
jgi:hypothetical protein